MTQQMFDKTMLLYEGREVYFGSMAMAKAYFTRLGFICPERTTTPDFSTSLTSPSSRVVNSVHRSTAPVTAEDFARAWRMSPEYEQLRQDMQTFDRSNPLVAHNGKQKGQACVSPFIEEN